MKTKIAIAISTLLLFLASAAIAQDSEEYCKYVQEQSKADGLRLMTPSGTTGFTSPNTGTAPQTYAGLMGSLSDYRKGRLTIQAAKENCSLYESTNVAQQAITYAASYLEQRAVLHRIALDEAALAKIDSLIDQNVQMIQAQSATKLSLYALQTAKAHLVQDRAASQRSLASRYIPEMPDVPLSRLVIEKQNDEQRNQQALAKIAKQQTWDLRWEAGYHRTVADSPGQGLVSSSGAYGGFALQYNLGSKHISQHLDAAAKSYAEWKREEDNDVVQSAEQLRQQLVDAIRVESNRMDNLKAQQNTLDENIALVQDVSTGAGITFANQLAADRLMLGVELKDSEYRMSMLRDYLEYNFEARTNANSQARVSITFDDGFESAYIKALPILDKAGIKATWYIITNLLNETGYMTADQVKALAADGQEVGGHTRTHPHLPTLTVEQQESEIAGSRQDLFALGINATSFAYPYGEHNEDSLTAVQAAGFTSARTTDQNLSGRNPFLLQGYSITPDTTLEEIRHAIAQAQSRGTWLILTFHRIDDEGSTISTSGKLLQQLVDYLVQNHITVTTVGEREASVR
jgi:peptidoglycan/xylan/chitin deacetylase (PgdA/CDA1 family)